MTVHGNGGGQAGRNPLGMETVRLPHVGAGPGGLLPAGPGLLDAQGRTHPGQHRETNEDTFLVEPPGSPHVAARGQLLIVADGMGGHAAGDVASRIAVETVRAAYYSSTSGSIEDSLREAIEAASTTIRQAARDDLERAGMGSTVVAAVILGSTLVVAHVGDSRAYLVRQGQVRRITRDHSLVAQMIEDGSLSPDEAEQHPDRNVVLRALGPRATVDVDVSQVQLDPGDTLVLCSDGLTAVVSDAEIGASVHQLAPGACADALITLANQRGAPDNVTLVVAGPNRSTASAWSRSARLPIIVGVVALVAALAMGLLVSAASVRTSTALDGSPTPGPSVTASPPAGTPVGQGAGATAVPTVAPAQPSVTTMPATTVPGKPEVTGSDWPADQPTRPAVVLVAQGVRLRSQPGTGASTTIILAQGTRLDVLSEPASGPDEACARSWYRARRADDPRTSGFVCGAMLRFDSAGSPEPVSGAAPSPSPSGQRLTLSSVAEVMSASQLRHFVLHLRLFVERGALADARDTVGLWQYR